MQGKTVVATGATLLARCKRRVEALETRLTAGLSPAEEKAVRRWLASVATKSEAKA
jgi:hypothetical protein